MKNRAKCRLCQSIIESFHPTDYVICKCGEIAVDGGEGMVCFAKDFSNFLRVDDEGNEIIVSLKDLTEDDVVPADIAHRHIKELEIKEIKKHLALKTAYPKRAELLNELDEMIKSIEGLPKHALYEPVTQCELASVLMLLSAILRS